MCETEFEPNPSGGKEGGGKGRVGGILLWDLQSCFAWGRRGRRGGEGGMGEGRDNWIQDQNTRQLQVGGG